MYDFLQQNELSKTLERFNKIRLYHQSGWINLLPVKYLKKNPYKYHQIQLNTDTHFNAIIMDIDDEELLTEWNVIGLPTPTVQTLNSDNNKAHLVWLLNVPVSKRNKKALKYYKKIVDSIKMLIGADRAYQNHQTKNFLNIQIFRVTYNDVAYDLDDFQKFIINDKLDEYSSLYKSELQSSGSRHIDLFNQLRYYGYKIAKDKDLYEKLQKRAQEINESFYEPINSKSIIKSVYKFCEKNASNFKSASRHYNKGVMRFKKIKNLSKDKYKKEVQQRQHKSSQRTATIKRLRTAKKIKVAIDFLNRKKIKLTLSNIAKYANISLRTVKNYTKTIKLFLRKSNGAISSIRVIVLDAEERSTKPLKYLCGVWQRISAFLYRERET